MKRSKVRIVADVILYGYIAAASVAVAWATAVTVGAFYYLSTM